MTDLLRALQILRAGGIVAIPTDTVYGLAADATQPIAIQRIFERKGREAAKPLPLLISTEAVLSDFALDMPELIPRLTQQFWPGPLTLVLKKSPQVSDAVTAGHSTVGIRIPNHPIALAILKHFPQGLAVSSANFSHQPAAIHASEIPAGLADLILENPEIPSCLASTVLDCTGFPPKILRVGGTTETQLQNFIHGVTR